MSQNGQTHFRNMITASVLKGLSLLMIIITKNLQSLKYKTKKLRIGKCTNTDDTIRKLLKFSNMRARETLLIFCLEISNLIWQAFESLFNPLTTNVPHHKKSVK